MITMPKELKEKWVAALRSGEYEQCIGRLHNGSGYCCLGVLQKVADGKVEAGIRAFPSDEWVEKHGLTHSIDGCWARFWHVTKDGVETGLADLNDTGVTFTEIADIIEEQVVGA